MIVSVDFLVVRSEWLRRLFINHVLDGPGQAGPAQYLSNLSIQNFDLGDHIGPHQKPVPSTFGDSANHIFTESQELYDEGTFRAYRFSNPETNTLQSLNIPRFPQGLEVVAMIVADLI